MVPPPPHSVAEPAGDPSPDFAPSASGPRSPNRWPTWYLGFAHLCLGWAGALLLFSPETLVGSYYHPQAMVPVHLVTLGWITSSILGALYLIAPMALRIRLPPSKIDGWAFGFHALGVVGMVSHFAMPEYSGMVWSAFMVLLAVLVVAVRILPRLLHVPVAAAVKTAVVLAFVNFTGAWALGATAGLRRTGLDLPGQALPTVWAHVHLAGLGWVTMMIVGAGYRLLPMILPAAMPSGLAPLVSVLVLEVGVVGLAAGLFLGHQLSVVAFSGVVALGFALFADRIRWMLRHRRRPARDLPRPRLPLFHLGQAGLYLLAALCAGSFLVLGNPGPLVEARLIPVYATCGIVGFAAQMVTGVSSRLWPLYCWQRAFAAGGPELPPSPHAVTDVRWRGVVLGAWTLALPLLVAGLALAHPPLVGAGGAMLGFAALVDAVDGARLLRAAARDRRRGINRRRDGSDSGDHG